MRPLALLPLVIAIAAALGVSADAWAQQDRDDRRGSQRQERARPERPRDTLSDSVRRVARDTRGQVLSAESVPFDGREMHRVKVLDDRGRVRVFMDDPQQRRGNDDGRPRRGRPTRGDDD